MVDAEPMLVLDLYVSVLAMVRVVLTEAVSEGSDGIGRANTSLKAKLSEDIPGTILDTHT